MVELSEKWLYTTGSHCSYRIRLPSPRTLSHRTAIKYRKSDHLGNKIAFCLGLRGNKIAHLVVFTKENGPYHMVAPP